MDETLKLFFSRSFEIELNNKLLYRDYVLNQCEVREYILKLLQIPFSVFIEYIIDNYNVSYLSAEDVLQFSDLKNATTNLCYVLRINNDEGYKVFEIGKFLENDGKIRKKEAYIKYGENHAKTAESLGLVFNLSNVYFLSCLGYVINDLPEREQIQLIARIILRNRLIQRLIYRTNMNAQCSYMKEVDFLKKSTALRRKSNVKKLIKIVSELYPDFDCEYGSKIVFD